jgi:DNA-binding response OmpR family regulator
MQDKNIVLECETRTAVRAGKKIKLSPKEYKLLSYFLEHKNSLVDRRKLLTFIWQYAPDVETRVVDVYVGYLRRKIDSGFSERLIYSVRGSGYIFRG